METHLAKNRAIQAQLQKCRDVIQDPIKKQRLELMLAELRTLEQNMLFKNVLHIQTPKKPRAILDESQSSFRVRAEEANERGRTTSERKIVASLEAQRAFSQQTAFVNRLFPRVLENPNASKAFIVSLVNNDAEIPKNMKASVATELIRKWRGDLLKDE